MTITAIKTKVLSYFINLEHINWTRVAWVLGALAGAWLFLQGVIPEPWHDILFGIISFLSTFIALLLKSEKEQKIPTEISVSTSVENKDAL